MCASSVVTAVCRDGPTLCSQTGAEFIPLSRVLWGGPQEDIDPGHSPPPVSPASIADACFRFSFQDLNANDMPASTPFTFGPTPQPGPAEDDGCGPAAGDYRDADFDGIYDNCDLILSSVAPADGVQQITLRNTIRNAGFGSPFDLDCNTPPCDSFEIGGLPVAIAPGGSGSQLNLEVPRTAQTGTLEIVRNPLPPVEASEIAPQLFMPRWFGYVSDGTTDGVLTMDAIAELATDGNPSPTNSLINLNCDSTDSVVTVGAPRALAARQVASTLTPGVSADREIFAVSDVTLSPPGTESRLFGFRVPDHRLIQAGTYQSGVPLPGPASALDVTEDADGKSMAYVAWKLQDNLGKIAVVDVDDPNTAAWGSLQPGTSRSPASRWACGCITSTTSAASMPT
jgi:hypothetical protein